MTDNINDIRAEFAEVLASAKGKLELLGLSGVIDIPFERAECPESLKRARVVFVGAELDSVDTETESSELLKNMISAMKLKHGDVCVIEDVEAFKHFDIKELSVHFIVALGAEALTSLTGSGGAFGGLRGRFLPWSGVNVMATYHPLELLANPALKRAAWDDIKKVMARLKST